MALTVSYAIALAEAVEPFDINWIEEPLQPDAWEGFKLLEAAMPRMKWSMGEHEYTRYGFRKLIEGRHIDILQPDITWVGVSRGNLGGVPSAESIFQTIGLQLDQEMRSCLQLACGIPLFPVVSTSSEYMYRRLVRCCTAPLIESGQAIGPCARGDNLRCAIFCTSD